MYQDFLVKIPEQASGITRKTIKGVTYVYYSYGRAYDAGKKYTVPKNTTIGKCPDRDSDMMYPNANYTKYFPDAELPTDRKPAYRSGCLRIGTFLVIRKLIAELQLDELLMNIFGKDSGLFLDLAAYSVITENNAGQYYPDYAFNHPLLTYGMKIYSDSKVSDFIGSITRDQSISFQNGWNDRHDHRQKIYVSYDSTNKNCAAGDIDLVEFGHPKDDQGLPVLNCSIAYDTDNAEPLFYGEYPDSIVDVSQLQLMLGKAKGYGYHQIGFVLDRGYFSRQNIRYMDKCGFDFIIMMKGMKPLVRDLVAQVKGTFEEKRECSIRSHRVNGITVRQRLYASDETDRYFHIYFNERLQISERENVEAKIDRMAAFLHEHEGTRVNHLEGFERYFDLIYYHPGGEDEKFMCGRERYEVINSEIALCGYFVIITSEKMTAEQALDLYKGRDASEKLFRGDKSCLSNRSLRIHSSGAAHAKILIEFVALIIRNRIYTLLKEQTNKSAAKHNYMTVPAAIRELEKIEIVRQPDQNYRLDYALTASQKEILKAFGWNETNIREQAAGINEDLQRLIKEVQ